MSQSPFIICAVLTTVVVVIAMATDLLWRRIPNILTFPALGIAIVVRTVFQGWEGLGLALGGAVLAPSLLMLLRGGKKIGMGDIKLAMAIGAIIGPILVVPTMFASALIGGVLAVFWMTYPGGPLAQIPGARIFRPLVHRMQGNNSVSAETMPYGVALGVASLLTMAVSLWTGNENWFFSLVGIGANL